MGLLAVFGITNDGLNLAVNLLLLFLFVFWLALVYWTYADARRRIADPMLVACATAASLFPFVGTVVYLIVRPPEYMEDVRERELEIAAAEARLASAEHHVCPYCSYEVEKAFLRCPSCLRRLKEPCTTCGKPLDPRWTLCPYCEAEVGQAPQPARRERPRRRERPPAAAAQRPAPAGAPRTAAACTPRAHRRARRAPRPGRATAGRAPAACGRAHRGRRRRGLRRAAPGPPGSSHQLTLHRKDPMDRTLILIKPDAFERRLTGELIARFERKGLTIAALKHMTVPRETAEQHYAEHSEKPFFGELVDFITGGPLVAMVLEGHEAVAAARQVIGATNPLEAAPGSIRGDHGLEVQTNLVHGSDSAESAQREAALFFPEL